LSAEHYSIKQITFPNATIIILLVKESESMNGKTIGVLSLAIVLSMLAFGFATSIVYAPLTGDVNGDGVVNMRDISIAIGAFNSSPGSPRWVAKADVDNSGHINMRDILIIVMNFGKTG
jgi:hypothetical protein